ncbi:MAG: hypothetical protein Q7S26_01995 [bacterium]|nr:hypothetical protein [bacterium]
MEAAQEQTITWHVQTHEHRERSSDWYWALGLLALAGAGASVFFGNILLAIILVVGAGSIGLLAARGPREHAVKIDKRGVSLDGTLYLYPAIQSFWVEEEVGEPTLFLTTNSIVMPHVSVPLDNAAHAGQVRAYLRRYVEEEEQWPHFGENIARLLGL